MQAMTTGFIAAAMLILQGLAMAQPLCEAGGPSRATVSEFIQFDATGSNSAGGIIVVDDKRSCSSCETTAEIDTETTPICDADGPYFGGVGEAIQFDGTGSNSPGGTIVTYFWDFGDGATGTGAMPLHAYTAGGVYTVGLLVIDNRNEKSVCETIADIAPVGVEPETWGRIKKRYH